MRGVHWRFRTITTVITVFLLQILPFRTSVLYYLQDITCFLVVKLILVFPYTCCLFPPLLPPYHLVRWNAHLLILPAFVHLRFLPAFLLQRSDRTLFHSAAFDARSHHVLITGPQRYLPTHVPGLQDSTTRRPDAVPVLLFFPHLDLVYLLPATHRTVP